MRVDLGGAPLERGGYLRVERALREAAVGERVEVVGADPGTLRAWCRERGHGWADGAVVKAADGRFVGALPTGSPDPSRPGAIAARADPRWGLAARGATVEDGPAELDFPLADDRVWCDDAPRLYAQAAAAQWDPETAIPWDAPRTHDDALEEAVVQVMTYLVENETAALLVPARFVARIHPHYREVVGFLSTQIADEARHVEVFTRRARLSGDRLGTSSRGGQASLATLVREPDFGLASFLLSVMGEASFLELLRFLQEVAPDPVTRAVARLAAQDEARHVAFAVGHLRAGVAREPALRSSLAAAVRAREAALRHSAGLGVDVFDALVLLAAGSYDPPALPRGFDRVVALVQRMDRARRGHLVRLGFDEAEAEALSGLHTRNFM